MRYSPSTRAFYDPAIHGDAIPADAVPLSPASHRRLLDAQAEGREIRARADGRPVAAPRRKPNLAEQRAAAIAAVKREAERRILLVASVHVQLNDLALLAIETAPGLRAPALARRAAIDAIRAASNRAEASAARLSSAALVAFDPARPALWSET